MRTEIITATAQAVHQLGAVAMVGGLFFLLFIVRAVTRETLNTEDRHRFYQLFYRYLIRWQWFALLLLWSSGGWAIRNAGIANLPLSVKIMAAGGAAATLLTLAAHTTCYFRLSERVEAEHWGRAARISSYVRKIMALNLLICLLLVLAGAAAPFLQTLSSP